MTAKLGLLIRRSALPWLMAAAAFILACATPTTPDTSVPGSTPEPATPTGISTGEPVPTFTAGPSELQTSDPTRSPTSINPPSPTPRPTATATPEINATPTPTPTATPPGVPTPTPTSNPGTPPTATPTATTVPTPSPTPFVPPEGSYVRQRQGFAVTLPEGWAVDDSDPTDIQIDPDFEGTSFIQTILAGPTRLDVQFNELIRGISGFQDFKELFRNRIARGASGYHAGVEWSDGSTPNRGDFILAVAGVRVIFLWISASAATYDDHRQEIKDVMDSFYVVLPQPLGPVGASEDRQETVGTIEDRVARIRGLPAPEGLVREFQTREEFELNVAKELVFEETQREAEMLKDLCVVLDLCSPSDDILRLLLGLKSKGILGYYVSEEKSLTVVTERDEPDLLSWTTYAHEYTHALQDGEFDLTTLEPEEDTFDSSKALTALLEGDANLTEYLFYESLPSGQRALAVALRDQKVREFSLSPEVAEAPPIILETFGWEHRVGPQLVFRLYLEGGFDAVNRAFLDPPRSTEQVIHPEKYLVREDPHPVVLPDLSGALGGDWRQRDAGVLGELLTGVHLAAFLDEVRANEAAAGWGGDRYALYGDGRGRLLMGTRFSWDTVADAQEFFDAYRDLVARKSGGAWVLTETGPNVRSWVGQDTSVHLAIEGDDTLVVIGPDRATVEAAVAAIPLGR